MSQRMDSTAARAISDPPPGFMPARVSIPPGSILPADPLSVADGVTIPPLNSISYAPRRDEVPDDRDRFVIRSRTETRILWAMFAAAMLLMTAYYWASLGVITRVLVAMFSSTVLVLALDFFQKVYVLLPAEIRYRVLFMWVRIPLPDVFTVERERGGGIVFVNSIDKERFFSIGRDMADETMTGALMSLYHYRAHSSFEVG